MKRPPPKPLPRLTDEAMPNLTLLGCHLCGIILMDPSTLRVYQECDEQDRPEPGRYLVACTDKACQKRIKDHPRLYVDVDVKPGAMPRLCTHCTFRRGLDCTHPDLKANGGPGLLVTLSGIRGIVCVNGGRVPRVPVDCAGQRLPGKEERDGER